MDLEIHRGNENKLHEELYKNVQLLSQFYPTTSDFKRVFKKDMFVKNNKAAFIEVIYYLLSVLNPEEIKKKITVYPPYDIKSENKFRNEVLNYVNKLNNIYSHANIPHLMQSHLISPGGFKFTEFMLKLSQLVIFEHLKKHKRVELFCPVTDTDIAFSITLLKKQTAHKHNEIQRKLQTFNNDYATGQQNSEKYVEKLSEINKKYIEAKEQLINITEEFNKMFPDCQSKEIKNEKLEILLQKILKHEDILSLLDECVYLSNNKYLLEYKKDELKVPTKIIHILRNREKLDLIEYFQGLNVLVENLALDLPNLTKSYIDSNCEKINEHTQKYADLLEFFKNKKLLIEETKEKLLNNLQFLENYNDGCILKDLFKM